MASFTLSPQVRPGRQQEPQPLVIARECAGFCTALDEPWMARWVIGRSKSSF